MMIKQTLSNQQGFLFLDFIFASVLVFALSAVIFSFAFTFSVVEVTQYISFATARNYSLAHLNQDEQKKRAQLKFEELTGNPAFKPLITGGWFELGEVNIGDFNNEFNPDSSKDSDNFIGARIPFSAPILYKRIPMLGTTASDPEGFQANVQSFLGREPNFDECKGFIEERAQRLKNLGLNFNQSEAAVIMDNGC